MPQINVLPGNDVVFLDDNGDERLARRWNEAEQRVDIIDPQTGNTIGYEQPDGTKSFSGPIDAPSASVAEVVNSRTSSDLINQGTAWASTNASPEEDPADTSATSYSPILSDRKTVGGIAGSQRVPAGATLYANFSVGVASVGSGETVDILPKLGSLEDGLVDSADIPELELTGLSAGTFTTGWQDISSRSIVDTEIVTLWNITAKVTGGTASFEDQRWFEINFEWRVD